VVAKNGTLGQGTVVPVAISTEGKKMGRVTLEKFKQGVNSGNQPDAVAKLTIIEPKKGGITFKVAVAFDGAEYRDLADDKGMVHIYKDVDTVIQALAKYQLTSMGITKFEVVNPEVLEAAPFNGDALVMAGKTRAKMVALAAKNDLEVAKIDAAIALMPAVTIREQALVAERTLQRWAVAEKKDYYTAEIARITAVIGA
jgi:hypothetical protein